LSGGQQQRVAIAIALSGHPKLLVLDESTTGLDVITQARILEEVDRLRRESGLGVVYVSHDLAVVAAIADRIAVMYAGHVVESAPADRLCTEPRHPYTQALLRSVPDIGMDRSLRLEEIAGQALSSTSPDRGGCPFEPRCPRREEICRSLQPPVTVAGIGHEVACHVAARGLAR
jgi:oligopeptide/dipeptide ABC transporter ATP-binding protein